MYQINLFIYSEVLTIKFNYNETLVFSIMITLWRAIHLIMYEYLSAAVAWQVLLNSLLRTTEQEVYKITNVHFFSCLECTEPSMFYII